MLFLQLGCSATDREALPGLTTEVVAPIVHGNDDRTEYFAFEGLAERDLVKNAIVALMPREHADNLIRGRLGELPTWGDLDLLCDGEPFAAQPSAAYCSGTLADTDLVLTSEHCLRGHEPGSWVVVFDYFYEQPGVLQLDWEDVYEPMVVVAAERRDDDLGEGADYAWIRLTTPAESPRFPAPLYTAQPEALALEQPIVNASAGGGTPIKLDTGGRIRELRIPEYDYFFADTDTSRGSSGSGAFTQNLMLIGVLARGGVDFLRTDDGCYSTSRPSLATEQFTHVHHAVEGLCRAAPDSALCRRPSAGSESASGGCSTVSSRSEPDFEATVVTLGLLAGLRFRRRSLRWPRRGFYGATIPSAVRRSSSSVVLPSPSNG